MNPSVMGFSLRCLSAFIGSVSVALSISVAVAAQVAPQPSGSGSGSQGSPAATSKPRVQQTRESVPTRDDAVPRRLLASFNFEENDEFPK